MPTTTKGIPFPDQTGVTRLWELFQALAQGVDPLLIGGVDKQEFTTSINWNKPSNAILSWCRGTGGGGGGGGAPTTAAGEASMGGGGGAAAIAELFIDADALSSTVAVTIGPGGAAGVATGNVAAGTGGTTSFGAFLSAVGGVGGFARVNSTTAFAILGGLGGATGTGVVSPGQPGGQGFGSGQLGYSGIGGSGPWGAGGNALRTTSATTSFAGNNGVGYGSGASGGICSGGMTGVLGGVGAPGYLIVYTLVG